MIPFIPFQTDLRIAVGIVFVYLGILSVLTRHLVSPRGPMLATGSDAVSIGCIFMIIGLVFFLRKKRVNSGDSSDNNDKKNA